MWKLEFSLSHKAELAHWPSVLLRKASSKVPTQETKKDDLSRLMVTLLLFWTSSISGWNRSKLFHFEALAASELSSWLNPSSWCAPQHFWGCLVMRRPCRSRPQTDRQQSRGFLRDCGVRKVHIRYTHLAVLAWDAVLALLNDVWPPAVILPGFCGLWTNVMLFSRMPISILVQMFSSGQRIFCLICPKKSFSKGQRWGCFDCYGL